MLWLLCSSLIIPVKLGDASPYLMGGRGYLYSSFTLWNGRDDRKRLLMAVCS